MNKTQLKKMLILTQPNCPKCGAKLVVANWNKGQSPLSHSAVIEGNTLVCFQCHRITVKLRDIEKLPFLLRWKKKIDRYTGIPTCLHLLRVRLNQFMYFKVRGGVATGRKPEWL